MNEEAIRKLLLMSLLARQGMPNAPLPQLPPPTPPAQDPSLTPMSEEQRAMLRKAAFEKAMR